MALKRPLRNLVSASGADIVSRLIGFVAMAYLARFLGTSSFGTVSIGFAVLGYILWFSSPGLQLLGTREVASGRLSDPAWISQMLSLRLLLALVGVLLTGGIGFALYGISADWETVTIFALTGLPLAWSLDWYFQGKEQLGVIAFSRILMYCSHLLLILLFVSRPEDMVWTPISYFAANTLAVLLLLLSFRSSGERITFVFSPAKWILMLKQGIPMGISSLLAQTTMNVPLLLAAGFLSTHETGLISAPLKLVFFALMIDRVFYVIFFPAITRQRNSETGDFPRLTTLGLKVVVTVSIPVLIAGIAASPFVVPFIFGEGYAESVPVLQMLLPYFLFTTCSTVLMSTLYADDREREYLVILAIGTIILVVLGIALTRSYGILGASLCLSATEAIIAVLLFTRVQRIMELRFMAVCGPAFGAGAAMAGILIITSGVSVVAMVPIAVICFFLVLYLLGGLRREDLRYLKERFV